MAQPNKFLTYSPTAKRAPFQHTPAFSAVNTTQDVSPEYLVHPADFDGHCHTIGPFPSFSRKLRFSFGEPFFHALVWYLSRLKFPDTNIDSTNGVTFLELALDFECASGIVLPGSSQRMKKQDGSVQRRCASMPVRFVQDPLSEPDEFLSHKIIQVHVPNKEPQFQCSMCKRSGNWAERSRFLKYSCAGTLSQKPSQKLCDDSVSFLRGTSKKTKFPLMHLPQPWGNVLLFLVMHVDP